MNRTRAVIEHDLREASVRLGRAEDCGDGAAIADYTVEVDGLVAELAEADTVPPRVD